MESINDFDEEDRKPNIQYLDSLITPRSDSRSESLKRSRSREDIGDRENKALRSNMGTPIFSRSPSGRSSTANSPDSPSALQGATPPQSRSDSETESGMVEAAVQPAPPPVDDPVVLGKLFLLMFSYFIGERRLINMLSFVSSWRSADGLL